VPAGLFHEGLETDIGAAHKTALALLRQLTATVSDVSLPLAADRLVLRAEQYAFHAPYFNKAPELYQADTRARLSRAADVVAADYIVARRNLQQLRRSIRDVFRSVDLLITPTTPIPPSTINEAREEGENLLRSRNTRPFNHYALPTVSVPCGFTRNGLPIGLQISGPPWAEGRVLALARAYGNSSLWHKQRPAMINQNSG
jgi:aspartyl-tRNA(Asn)/glutamyl-tRNA(Gln) amidotransferase subunit A